MDHISAVCTMHSMFLVRVVYWNNVSILRSSLCLFDLKHLLKTTGCVCVIFSNTEPFCMAAIGRHRLRRTRGTTPRSCWWETSVTWRTRGWWQQTVVGSSLNTWVSLHHTTPTHRSHHNYISYVWILHEVHSMILVMLMLLLIWWSDYIVWVVS